MTYRLRPGFIRAACIVTLGAALACARAAELGEAVVRSYIGQPLVADIELTGFANEAEAVVVKLARPDVYQGANIAIQPALASVRLSVMRRDGRQFLHMTTIAPVETPYVHIFLELADGGRSGIRALTLWLPPDPEPAPPQSIMKAPAPAPAPVPVPVLKPKPAAPAPARRAPVAAAPVCPKPRYTDEQVRACATRDYKNALLTAQIVELEEKVRGLRAAVEPGTAVAGAAPHAVSRTGQLPTAKGGVSWPWVGAGIAACMAAAAIAVMLLKRRGRLQKLKDDLKDN